MRHCRGAAGMMLGYLLARAGVDVAMLEKPADFFRICRKSAAAGSRNPKSRSEEAAFRTATRTDPTFAEAWYNLGDLLDDQGRTDGAIECLRKARRLVVAAANASLVRGESTRRSSP